ncbi:MAG: C4-type zinc ribbon domain-containing protein [Desulfosarcinaceae bacterium]|nr:C4-type zinc ribbon domain-containing protein [Desulfosarcinaceae bacterium]
MSDDIREQIHTLNKLQTVEDKLHQLQIELNQVDTNLTQLDSQLVQSLQEVANLSGELEAIRKTYREGELDIKVNQETIAKSDAKLRQVKTNKEYQATLREIDELKRKNSALEDELLGLLDKIESTEAMLAEREKRAEQRKNEIVAQQNSIREEAAKKQAVLGALQAERSDITTAIPKSLMVQVENIKSLRGRPIIAAVSGAICSGCNMNIPAQLYNELQRFDSLKRCPMCQRIIYWNDLRSE